MRNSLSVRTRVHILMTAAVLGATVARGADWPQWGRTLARDSRCTETGLPDSFDAGRKKPGGGVDMATTRNVKWAARLGSAAYGNPTVAGGRIFVGTDDSSLTSDKRFKRNDLGVVGRHRKLSRPRS